MVAFPDFSSGRERRAGRAFTCTLQAGDLGPTWVRLAGDLDRRGAPRLEQALHHAVTPPWTVVVDLRQLNSIDSSGVQVIVDASTRARRTKRRLLLVRGPAYIDHMLALAAALGVVEIVALDPLKAPLRALHPLAHTDDAA